MEQTKRNGYIDIIKFVFALVIMEFHQGTGLFPGGRIAVEGFFMISGYLMMRYLERNPYPQDGLGLSTARFIGHKYKSLLPFLLPSVLLGYIVSCITGQSGLKAALAKLPLLLFEVVPLKDAGFAGYYVLGISWYLSAMFVALAILYPMCKKWGRNFVLTVCPVAAMLIYGYFSSVYGHLAIGSAYIDGIMINVGVLRGFAASALGCVLYEICKSLSGKKVSIQGRLLFALLEVVGFALLFALVRGYPKSKYDYVCIFVIFGLLIIGISGISATSLLYRGNWTKKFGTWSTLIVLNHYCFNSFLSKRFGAGYIHTNKVWLYHLCVICACVVVYFLSKVVELVMKKLSEAKLFEKE